MSLFVAGTILGEVQVSLFVAGAVFGEDLVSLFVAGVSSVLKDFLRNLGMEFCVAGAMLEGLLLRAL